MKPTIIHACLLVLISAASSAWADKADAPRKSPITQGVDPLGTDDQQTDDGGDEQLSMAEEMELMKLFVDTLDEVERNYVEPISRRELMEAAIDGLLSKLDQHSDYIGREDLDRFRRSVDSEFGGIGIRISDQNGRLTVISPLPDSPAFRAGMKSGDQILKVDGQSVAGLSFDQVISRISGEVGTSVELAVLRADGQQESIRVERYSVRLETVIGFRRRSDNTWNHMLDDGRKIAYVRIDTFSKNTTEELQATMDRLTEEKMAALVLDLRFNPGGLLTSAISVCDLFISEGTIVSTDGRGGEGQKWEAKRQGTFPHFPMVVLANGHSASASEIVAACLQDHQRAVVIGQRTWGKGSVQRVIDLEGGRSALKLTTSSYLRPNGKNIHRFENSKDEDDWGVRPNRGFEVLLSDQETLAVRVQMMRAMAPKPGESDNGFTIDRQISKAISYLSGKITGR